jgi:hypothetical protein
LGFGGIVVWGWRMWKGGEAGAVVCTLLRRRVRGSRRTRCRQNFGASFAPRPLNKRSGQQGFGVLCPTTRRSLDQPSRPGWQLLGVSSSRWSHAGTLDSFLAPGSSRVFDAGAAAVGIGLGIRGQEPGSGSTSSFPSRVPSLCRGCPTSQISSGFVWGLGDKARWADPCALCQLQLNRQIWG